MALHRVAASGGAARSPPRSPAAASVVPDATAGAHVLLISAPKRIAVVVCLNGFGNLGGWMKRAVLIAAALSVLLPDVSVAQQPPPPRPGPPGGGPPGGPGRPMPGPPSRPVPGAPPRPMPGRPMPPPAFHRPPVTIQPLPPRGNQFWHRGQYYGRVPGPAFAYPPGWRYRQWSIGQRLPPVFLAPAYFYAGWAALGLQAPVAGYSWVRFGPDLLLVNLTTGEVEDVVYGAFL
jgi:hypothetical protein